MDDDTFDNLADALAIQDLPFIRYVSVEGKVAIFPKAETHIPGSKEQYRVESEWEARCAVMHDSQVVILPVPKPKVI